HLVTFCFCPPHASTRSHPLPLHDALPISGAHTSAWTDPRPGANVARAAQFMLFAQVEPGHACPISMTHAVVPSLRFSPEIAQEWFPRVASRSYDPALAEGKAGAIFGMAMTEKQGGSDVRAN